MIDPKFNKLPTKDTGEANDLAASGLSEEQKAERLGSPRPGLSINDTVAANANLSVGSRGTNVSGVSSGSGAGAGTTYLTPGTKGESPAPNVVPGVRGSGTTPISDSGNDERPSANVGADEDRAQARQGVGLRSENQGGGDVHTASYEDIASHAYRCWHERGCPEGSPEEDWHRAEQELRMKGRTSKASAANA